MSNQIKYDRDPKGSTVEHKGATLEVYHRQSGSRGRPARCVKVGGRWQKVADLKD